MKTDEKIVPFLSDVSLPELLTRTKGDFSVIGSSDRKLCDDSIDEIRDEASDD